MLGIVFFIDYVIIVLGDGMKSLYYIVVYGFFGYVLERLINLIVFGYWLDNRVLHLPVQPMYGLGVVLTLLLYKKIRYEPINPYLKWSFLVIIAVLSTALSELMSGLLFEALYGRLLWNYQITFPSCYLPYACIIPTTFFGLLALFSVVYVHPYVEAFAFKLPRAVINGIVGLVFIDFILTYYEVFYETIRF